MTGTKGTRLGLLLSFLVAPGLHAASGAQAGADIGPGLVRYHQDWLALRSEAFAPADGVRPGVYRGGAGSIEAVDFDDPRSVFRFVLANAPERPIVFPSEGYYYYEFALGERIVSGNLRFTEIDKGEIHIGYFDRLDRSAMRWEGFTAEDGVEVGVGEDGAVTVREGELARVFTLYEGAFDNRSDIELVEGERYVSGIVDESGYFFHLIYCEPHRTFYYVLQNNRPLPEPSVRLRRLEERLPEGMEALLGAGSRFVFIRDLCMNRTILVCVHSAQTAANTYYDGPFDQVPPRLEIREMLETVYPYVRYRGGIDRHGRFLYQEGQRVAISPYFDYGRFDDIEEWLGRTIDGEAAGIGRWVRAVFEPKRNFHLRIGLDRGVGAASYRHDERASFAWPAGHWVPASRGGGGGAE